MNKTKIDQTENQQQNSTENAEQTQNDICFDDLTLDEAVTLLKQTFDMNAKLSEQVTALTEALEKSTATAQTNQDNWYRCAAEFENYKKRNATIRQDAYFDGKKDVLLSFLAVGDSVDRALSVQLDDKTREGVMLIKKQFTETLSHLGVEEIDPLGETFDPTTSEAIAVVDAGEDEQSQTVKTVFKKGYKMSGKMLRYAQVIVIK